MLFMHAPYKYFPNCCKWSSDFKFGKWGPIGSAESENDTWPQISTDFSIIYISIFLKISQKSDNLPITQLRKDLIL